MESKGYNSKADLPNTKGTGPYRHQRDDSSGRDGMGKQAAQHNEDPNLKGSFGAVASHLHKQDSLDTYQLAGSYGKRKMDKIT